jgi:hypothetical protein
MRRLAAARDPASIIHFFARAACLNECQKTYGPYCYVIDIGSRKPYPGAKATAQRLKDIEAACKNIFGLWPSITASLDD